MRPLTSGRSITPWLLLSDPTACTSSVSVINSARATSTVAGPPWPPPPVTGPRAPEAPPCGLAAAAPSAVLAGWFCHHQAAPAARAMPMTATKEWIFFNAGLVTTGDER